MTTFRLGQVTAPETTIPARAIVDISIELPEWFGAPQRLNVEPEDARRKLVALQLGVDQNQYGKVVLVCKLQNTSDDDVKVRVVISNIPPLEDE